MSESRGAAAEAGVGRRTLLKGGLLGGAGALTLAGGVASGTSAGQASTTVGGAGSAGSVSGILPTGDAPSPVGHLVEPFHGAHQAGIATVPQSHAVFVALDLDEGVGVTELGRLMRVWTDDIARLASGRAPVTDQEPELAARPAGLTVTVGWGAGLFGRLGTEHLRPRWLAPLPPLPIDDLDGRFGEADLLLQIGAHSPVTLAHARRHLVGAARGIASPRWLQPGFREPMERDGWSLRNQFGQVDGTVQPDVDGVDAGLLWIDAHGQPAWEGGSSLVLRRIRMDLAGWERADRVAREHAVGRDLATGAPLTGGEVATPVDLHAVLPGGLPVVDRDAHARRAGPHAPHQRFLRRPYTYEEVSADGTVETGLLFAAYQADPLRQFLPVQRRLAEADLLNLWTTPVGSAVFALLPGCPEGGWLGQHLLA
ncbi:Dyp-type peroxidase [Ornithinimicrobium sp. LYQ121]|uniref:Dyp-type peroxidase n=1 Tax=Ornithinimicrobium sp. LYQ121 TaxID=3378801 RepID=UPI0038534BA2